MRFSVFTAALPQWTPQEAVEQLAAQGWDGVEWRVVDQQDAPEPGFWAGNRCTWPLATLERDEPRIRELTEGAGLRFSGVGGYALCDEHADVDRLLAATAALGARQVRVRTPALGSAPYPELFAHARSFFVDIAGRAARHGVKVLVELHHQTVVSSSSAALRLLDGVDPAAIGVIHDLGNLVIEGGEDVRAGLEMLGPYLAHVHVKNCVWRPAETEADGTVRWEHAWAELSTGQAVVPAAPRGAGLRRPGHGGGLLDGPAARRADGREPRLPPRRPVGGAGLTRPAVRRTPRDHRGAAGRGAGVSGTGCPARAAGR